jgi:hypothetical protein
MERLQPKIKPIKEAPNLEEVKKRFKVDENVLIIAYGDSIYVPDKGISTDLLIHELVHCKRQGGKDGARRWWEKYFEDKEFRKSEELLAYREQYKYCCQVHKDRNKRAKILVALAQELCSPMYDLGCWGEEARLWIKELTT